EARSAQIDGSLQAARQAFEALQPQCVALQEASAQAAEAVGIAEREHAAAQAQLATLRQIQAEAQNNAPLREWLERHGLATAAQLWHKLRIDAGWETAVEAVLRERLHALQSGSIDAGFSERPPAKASLFEASREVSTAPAADLPLAAKVHALDDGIRGALTDWLSGVFVCEGRPSASIRGALPAGAVLVNREGDQFTRHTVSLHAPDPADAGLLARRAEIEALEGRCAELARQLVNAQHALEQAEGERAEQRKAVQQAERDAQDALFGERECASKMAEIDHSVNVIDQQIERAELEVAKLTEELAADPIPGVRQGLDAAVEGRLGCEKTLAAARNTAEGAAGALREIEEAKLAIEAKVLPMREGLGVVRKKE